MEKSQKDTVHVRLVSSAFTLLALCVFKPFGLDAWQWQAYFHLLMIFVFGFIVCMLTDLILKYIIRMPMSMEKGVGYVIRRNLWFQLINTPLVSLSICLYRHFVLSDRVEGNVLSWSNFLETLVILAFCSFAIGLYWRFKFRNKYLSTELEEAQLLNEQLRKVQDERLFHKEDDTNQASPTVTLTGTTSETITLDIPNLLYIEAIGNYVKVYHLREGMVRNDMLRATSKQIEEELRDFPMVIRSHRAFLVNLQQVERIVTNAGNMRLLIKHCHESIPVSRSNMSHVKDAIA